MGKSLKIRAWQQWSDLRAVLTCFTFFIVSILSSQPQNHYVYPPASGLGTTIIDTITFPDIRPGDIVCLMAGTFKQILIRDIHGLPGKAINFRNEGGKVIISNDAHYGISVRNCSHINISGSGHCDIQHGILIEKVEKGSGISFEKLSTDFSLSSIEITNTKLAAIVAKSDPNCTFESLRENFTMRNLSIHDNFIHDVHGEALYIGHSYYNGLTLNCNGVDTLVLPHVNIGVHVFNNTIQHTGRNAMQVSSSYSDCSIHNNSIQYDSQSEVYNQMGGIIIGAGSVCDCYNNYISHGKGVGIEIFGRGNMMIYNNLIINPGKTFRPEEPISQNPKHGIFIKNVNTDSAATIHVFHNTIISPKNDGIWFENNKLPGSRIQNNIITDPGSFAQIGQRAFVNHANLDLIVSNNLFTININEVYFKNNDEDDYTLRYKSPAVDKGLNLSEFNINFDFSNQPRPMGKATDIGAYEFDPENDEEISQSFLKVFPNPFSKSFSFSFFAGKENETEISIFNLTGRRVYHRQMIAGKPGLYKLEICDHPFESGLYILTLSTPDSYRSIRIICIR